MAGPGGPEEGGVAGGEEVPQQLQESADAPEKTNPYHTGKKSFCWLRHSILEAVDCSVLSVQRDPRIRKNFGQLHVSCKPFSRGISIDRVFVLSLLWPSM
jgi:hypothetical protein